MESQQQQKKKRLKMGGFQLKNLGGDTQPEEDQVQDDTDIQKQQEQKQNNDNIEAEIIEQIQKLSLQNRQKTTEIKDKDQNLLQIMPTDSQSLCLKDFKSLETLGKGNSGNRVDKVIHVPTKQIFALKKISLINDEKFRKYLHAEIKALMAAESQYITKQSGAFFDDGHVNILLEYMDYGSLTHLLQKVKTIPDVILGIIIYQILLGLDYLHNDLRIMHRDIKPLNILLNSQGYVKITDFGVCGGTTKSVQMLNSWVGTTLYMSPERLKQDKYSYDTDIWSLGMTILECILGTHPLNDKDNSFWSLLEQVQSFKVPELPKTTAPLLKNFVLMCLDLDRNKRPTVKDLLNHELMKKFQKLENGGRDKFVQWLNCLKLNQNNNTKQQNQ